MSKRVRESNRGVRVLAFAGSPRRGGNTDALLAAALEGAQAAGARVERHDLCALTIAACRHCGGCAAGQGVCVVHDDMTALYEPLRAAERIIIAAPIFFMSVPAQVKAMIDRCQPLWVRRHLDLPVSTAPGPRAGLFLGVAGSRRRHVFDAARSTLAAWYWTLEIFERRELTFEGIDAAEAIGAHPTALDDARQAGHELAAWAGR